MTASPEISTAPSSADAVLGKLNPEQRRAAEATTGPVCIIAGAGTGKTTTVTNRLAWQVRSGAFPASQLLALTFTKKAAGELQQRLAGLGVSGVDARTFHSAALRMLHEFLPRFENRAVPEIAPNKSRILLNIVRGLRMPYKFNPLRDFGTMIEWVANQQIAPNDAIDALVAAKADQELPPEIIGQVLSEYSAAKARQGVIDFEDVLRWCIRLLEKHPAAAAELHARYAAFTVDEYQDVNPLQQRLLELWLGDRREICVVGDPYQSIYSFTGATPDYLLNFGTTFPGATLVKLASNYRSSPQVLERSNTLATHFHGTPNALVAKRGDGPEIVATQVGDDNETEAEWVTARCRELHAAGMPFSEMAILYRTRDQSTSFEQALGARNIPVSVDRGLLKRDAFKELGHDFERAQRAGAGDLYGEGLATGDANVADFVDRIARQVGYNPDAAGQGGQAEIVRQADLKTIVEVASTWTDAERTVEDFLTSLHHQFGDDNNPDGVRLMTLHSAKGLEFDAVFLPSLINGVLPYWKGKNKSPIDEERRLFYVGMTRARTNLHITWTAIKKQTPSLFLEEAGIATPKRASGAAAGKSAGGVKAGGGRVKADDPVLDEADQALFDSLRAWRTEAAAEIGKPAYVVLSNKTLFSLVEAKPSSKAKLLAVNGIGDAKYEAYGDEILGIVARH
ncbi:MAG: ATP-dependent DNA helicase UvrD2 [Thermoleophilia bacterium]|nr:ATP-dependent DNA helicase UvrD2 [Thermoleophilia bacterium]